MLSLTAVSKAEKNKLGTGTAFLILLEIQLEGQPVHICHNTENVAWRGITWEAFPFELGDVQETTDGSDPQVELRVSNASRALQYAVEEANGGVKTPAILRIVNSSNLDDPNADIEEFFTVTKAVCDQNFITFTLGTEYSSRTIRPLRRYFKNFCPYRFKGLECGYNGTSMSCGKTLAECRAKGNSKRFGGFAGIEQGGVYL